MGFVAVVAVTIGAFGAAAVWRRLRADRLAADRLFADDVPAPDDPPAGDGRVRPVFRRRPWVGPLVGLLASGVVWFASSLPVVITASAGLIVGLLTWQLLDAIHARRFARLEADLADAIDLMVGALGAGTGATGAIGVAARESRRPLQGVLEDVINRIRLGDAPRDVFDDLTDRVPRETFLLFASTLAVHWEVGGSLAPILASVGRTIRDRIEVGRRIRTNSVQARLSVIAILVLTYFLAFIMGRANPEQMEDFLFSEVAAWFIAGSMILQALGIFWMSRLAVPRF